MVGNRLVQGLVLRRQPYREHDLVIGLFSREEGYLELIARGARKAGSKLAGHLEPFTLSEVMVIGGRNKDYAASAINSRAFLDIKTDLVKLELAGQGLSFLLVFLRPGEKEPALFDLAVSSLEALEALESGSLALWGAWWRIAFQFRILVLSGYQPNFGTNCAACGKPLEAKTKYVFSLKDFCLYCQNCEQKVDDRENLLTISKNCVNIFHYLSGERRDIKSLKIGPLAIREADRLISRMKEYII